MSALREVVASFDVDVSSAAAKLSGLEKSVSNLTASFGALVNHYAGKELLSGIREFVAGQIEAGSAVNDMSEKLGVGVDELQRFQFATGLVGVGSEEAGKALQFLNKNMGEAIGGNKEAVQTFAKLGIQIKDANGDVRETGDILPELADAFEDMGSDAERTAFAMKIFGKSGASLLPLLKDGSKGLKAMSAEFDRLGGGMSEDFVKAADAAGDEVDKLKFALNGWKSQIAFAIFPLVTRMAVKFQGWIGTLRKITHETRLSQVAWTLAGVAGSIALYKLAAGFTQLLGVVPKGASIWETLLSMGELGLIIAGVAALVLVVEDLYTWLEGGESVTGDLLDGLFGIGASGQAIAEVKNIFADFAKELEEFKPIVAEFGDLFKTIWPYALTAIKAVTKFGLGQLAYMLTSVVKGVELLVAAIGGLFFVLGKAVGKMGELLDNDALKKFGGGLEMGGAKAGLTGLKTLGITKDSTVSAAAVDGLARPVPSQFREQNNDIEININGVPGDPSAVGQAVRGGVRRGLSDADADHALHAVVTGG